MAPKKDPEPEVVIEDQVPEPEPIEEPEPEPAPTRARVREEPAAGLEQIAAGIGRGVASALKDLGVLEPKSEQKPDPPKEKSEDDVAGARDGGGAPGDPAGDPRPRSGGFLDWFWGEPRR